MNAAALIFLAFVVIVGIGIYQTVRGQELLQSWARRNGYRILEKRRRWIGFHSFGMNSRKGDSVFYITVEDELGQVRTGLLRCNGLSFGEDIDVIWDERSS